MSAIELPMPRAMTAAPAAKAATWRVRSQVSIHTAPTAAIAAIGGRMKVKCRTPL